MVSILLVLFLYYSAIATELSGRLMLTRERMRVTCYNLANSTTNFGDTKGVQHFSYAKVEALVLSANPYLTAQKLNKWELTLGI